MKKIFARDKFDSDKNSGEILAGIAPEEYLKTMLSCVEDGVLYIAKEEDDVSIRLAENLSAADYVVKYTFDLSKIDAAAIAAKERALFAACSALAGKKEAEDKTVALRTAAFEKGEEGIRAANVLNRAQRVEKLLELGAPDFVVTAERQALIEELALNASATKREVIGRDDFLQAFGAC